MSERSPFTAVLRLSEDAFLAGPERLRRWRRTGGDLLDVDSIFGKPFTRVLQEAGTDDPGSVIPDDNAPSVPSLAQPGYVFRETAIGVLLLAPDGAPAGGYLGCDLAVDEAHQGLGLGAELALERFLREGRLPTWDLDAAAYSPAGEAAHRAAWRLARKPGFLNRKRRAWTEAEAALRATRRRVWRGVLVLA